VLPSRSRVTITNFLNFVLLYIGQRRCWSWSHIIFLSWSPSRSATLKKVLSSKSRSDWQCVSGPKGIRESLPDRNPHPNFFFRYGYGFRPVQTLFPSFQPHFYALYSSYLCLVLFCFATEPQLAIFCQFCKWLLGTGWVGMWCSKG
jgi:hypothetical protein